MAALLKGGGYFFFNIKLNRFLWTNSLNRSKKKTKTQPKVVVSHFINSPFCKDQFNEHLTGIGVPNLHLIDINRTIIPIPPLKEQERIVSKIKKLFLQLDQLQMNIV